MAINVSLDTGNTDIHIHIYVVYTNILVIGLTPAKVFHKLLKMTIPSFCTVQRKGISFQRLCDHADLTKNRVLVFKGNLTTATGFSLIYWGRHCSYTDLISVNSNGSRLIMK